MSYRLAIDIGSNSIGWCVLGLDQLSGNRPCSIEDMGVRIYPDGRKPKDGTSKAVDRRLARSMRRNRDRYLDRRGRLLNTLSLYDLMPLDEKDRRNVAKLDPYLLRARGVEEELALHEIGRAIFHLNQRRGFKSNRKSDAKDNETGMIQSAVKETADKIAEHGTVGKYLHFRRSNGLPVRARKLSRVGVGRGGKEKNEEYYDFYASRELIEAEFNQLWEVQSKFHPDTLTKEVFAKLREIIFFQRPLKSPPVGRCTFERNEERASKALPLVQRLRIYQELNHLHVIDGRTLRARSLTIDERDKLAASLCQPRGAKKPKGELSFEAMRKLLGLRDTTFSHETVGGRNGFSCDTTSEALAYKDRYGSAWYDLSDDDQERIVVALLEEDDEEALVQWLMETFKLDRIRATAVACTPLPDGHGRLGKTATRNVLEQLVQDVIPYSEAVVRAGYKSHSALATGTRRERLPYYGEVLERHVVPDPERGGHPAAGPEKRYGKVTNPTVHIALNQLRKVVNEIIKYHGPPSEIHLEVLRDLKNSLRQKREIAAEQAKNKEINDHCAKRLREEFHLKANRENIFRLRLWEELSANQKCCVYTGENIPSTLLFTSAVEIDHILPFSRTLDDGTMNKVLCKQSANREKRERTPFEAWGHSEQWTAILNRAELLPPNKRMRFAENAMERFQSDRDFIARQLTDSQYIARLAREYLAVLFEPGQDYRVVCLPGRLTAMFRHHLGLNSILDEVNPGREDGDTPVGEKNRNDHRHHAVDALVIGLMDRAFLQQAASIHGRFERDGVYQFLDGLPEPWSGFRQSAVTILRQMVVSHKLDHGIEAELHNSTAYGVAKRLDTRGNAVHRIPARLVTGKKLQSIKGKRLRAEIAAKLTGMDFLAAFEGLERFDAGHQDIDARLVALLGDETKETVRNLQEFLNQKGIRRVRLIEPIALVYPRTQPLHKGLKPDGNAYLEVFEDAETGSWIGKLVTLFDANWRRRKSYVSTNEQAPAGRHLFTLFNRDMLEMEHKGRRAIFYIQRMSEKQIALAEHFEANADSRTRDKGDPFNFVYKGSADGLRQARVRFLKVTPAGRIRYLSDPCDDSPGS
ncbi:MAG: hypothetical protein AMXMBFR84_34220 [Candidatus Hydrogenedentota bacterium]